MKLFAAIACAALLVLAGCGGGGGDDESSGDYVAELNDACTEQAALVVGLPQKQAEEDLSTEEAQQVVDDATAEFNGQVESLDVPSDQEENKQALLDLFQQFEDMPPSDRLAYRDQTLAIADAYDALGAKRCGDYSRASVEVIYDVPPASAYKGLPLPGVEGLDE